MRVTKLSPWDVQGVEEAADLPSWKVTENCGVQSQIPFKLTETTIQKCPSFLSAFWTSFFKSRTDSAIIRAEFHRIGHADLSVTWWCVLPLFLSLSPWQSSLLNGNRLPSSVTSSAARGLVSRLPFCLAVESFLHPAWWIWSSMSWQQCCDISGERAECHQPCEYYLLSAERGVRKHCNVDNGLISTSVMISSHLPSTPSWQEVSMTFLISGTNCFKTCNAWSASAVRLGRTSHLSVTMWYFNLSSFKALKPRHGRAKNAAIPGLSVKLNGIKLSQNQNTMSRFILCTLVAHCIVWLVEEWYFWKINNLLNLRISIVVYSVSNAQVQVHVNSWSCIAEIGNFRDMPINSLGFLQLKTYWTIKSSIINQFIFSWVKQLSTYFQHVAFELPCVIL